MTKLVPELVRLADTLDKRGLKKEADFIDRIIVAAEEEASEEDDGPSIKLYCPECHDEMGEMGEPATEAKAAGHQHQLGYWNTDPSHGKMNAI